MECKREIRFTKAPVKAKIKEGGHVIASEALHKHGARNLLHNCHLKRGDTVMLMTGPRKQDKKRDADQTTRLVERNAFKGTIGKVLAVYPKEGKVLIEGVNMVTNFIKARTGGGETGMVRKEEPVFASRVMLYDPGKKRPVRGEKRKELSV